MGDSDGKARADASACIRVACVHILRIGAVALSVYLTGIGSTF